MKAQDLYLEKIRLINWITRLQDAALIAELRKIQTQTDEENEIPQAHQEIVLARMKSTRREDYIPIEDLDDDLKQ